MRAVIDDAADIFTLINTFTVAPHRQEAVVASLRSFTERHARYLTGFVGASVHASLDGHRVVNYVQWETKADLDAMMATPQAKAHVAEVGALAARVDPFVYRVAFVGSRERGAQ
jgi:quinol monooxygenase YgiN